MEVKAKYRQSLLDMAVQTAGSVEAAFRLSAANDIGITETLEDGQVIHTVPVENADTVRRYEALDIRPATEISPEDMELAPYGGIGFMGIEIDFIVS
nr:MAG TPA: hypothetical protein [Caudoviricetes sp.]